MSDIKCAKKAFLYLTSGVLTLAFLAAGAMKVTGQEVMQQGFTHFGLPIWFMYLIGTAELLGAAGLWIRRLSLPSAVGLLIIMIGAFAMHIMHDPVAAAIPAVALAIILLIVIQLRRAER